MVLEQRRRCYANGTFEETDNGKLVNIRDQNRSKAII